MLVVVAACLTTRWLFKCDGLFQNVLRIQGKFRNAEAIEKSLSRTGVRSLMDRHLAETNNEISLETATHLLSHQPHWILLRESNQLLQPADLHAFLQNATDASPINLNEMPARRYDLAKVSADANLYEALELMNQKEVDVLWVESLTTNSQPLGIISRSKIENYYRI
jgi:CIC family chloride channel protein